MAERKAVVDVGDCWAVAEAVIGVSPRVLLYGPPGTGKTHGALRMGVTPGQLVTSLTCSEEMSGVEMRGHYVPKGGDWLFQFGPMLAAWRDGGRAVVNEIDQASPDAHGLLGCFLDDQESAWLTLPTGETIRPAAGFSVVATMNGDPAVDLHPRLRDRFPVCILIDRVHPAALAALPEDLRAPAERGVFAPEEERRTSIRVWLEFAKLRQAVGPEVAAAACFGPRATDVLNGLKIGGA